MIPFRDECWFFAQRPPEHLPDIYCQRGSCGPTPNLDRDSQRVPDARMRPHIEGLIDWAKYAGTECPGIPFDSTSAVHYVPLGGDWGETERPGLMENFPQTTLNWRDNNTQVMYELSFQRRNVRELTNQRIELHSSQSSPSCSLLRPNVYCMTQTSKLNESCRKHTPSNVRIRSNMLSVASMLSAGLGWNRPGQSESRWLTWNTNCLESEEYKSKRSFAFTTGASTVMKHNINKWGVMRGSMFDPV